MASTNHQYSNLAEESAKSEASAFVRPNPTVTRVGFIDLGSNSSRLTVVEFDRRGRVTVLNRVKSMVRLGEGAFETKKLQPQAMQRASSCLIEFADVCRSYGVSEVMAVGTAALRVASNSMDFVNEVKTKTGFDLQVISGDEEARLIRVGIWDSLPKTKDSFLFIDIGGGSTEISVSSREKISFLESLNIGCVMMTDAFKGNAQGKISSSVFAKMQQKALEKMQHILKKVERSKFAAAIASSGTAQALLALAQVKFGEQGGFAQKPAGIELKRSQIAALAKSLSQMSAAEREKLPGLSPARAQVIVGGAAILLSILQALDLPCVYITPNNLQ
ncbi:MAG TPA: Ppx/GppA family phosphatase, partial [Candidatus Aphodousia faecigallinarum]|nr:Ppx/GppA family phosphatase [Candidatus Aphodousia faecigallinarum]